MNHRGAFIALVITLSIGCDAGVLGGTGAGAGAGAGAGGVGRPSSAELESARARLGAALEPLDLAGDALDLLGFFPSYECGEPRRAFAEQVADGVAATVACAEVTLEPAGDTADRLVVDFGDGCELLGRQLEGHLALLYAGGDDRVDADLDLRDLRIDGRALPARAGYGTCGDETRYWVLVEAESFYLDARLADRPGVPIVGGTTVIIDATGERAAAGGAVDRITLTEIELELGALLPRQGTLLVETADGRRLHAAFDQRSPVHGTVTLTLDDHEPVTVTIPLL